MKNHLIGDVEERLVRYLSETYPGRVHDKHICDAEELVFPANIGLCQDTGFQGYHPAGVHIYQPKKKPKGKELTPEEKEENTIISSIRILIEHIIATDGVSFLHTREFQIPPDLVVKTQAIDIVEVIL